MKAEKERRKWPREALPTSEVGIVYPQYDDEGKDMAPADRPDTLVVPVPNRSEGGLLLESPLRFNAGSFLDVRIRLPYEKAWMALKGKVVRADESSDKQNHYLLGVEFQPDTLRKELPTHGVKAGKKRMYPSDVEFFMDTQLFSAISDEAKCPLLNCMTPIRFRKGQRVIRQGDEGDTFYIVQEGSCVAHVEKDGREHPIARLRAGDIIGEIALLTGEPRTAHVDAETNVKLWSMSRAQFDALCKERPDLRSFLGELVSDRLSSERLTAEKTVGKYVVNEIIGRGGWSIVYRGTHSSLNMPVAIKMLKHDMAMDSEFSEKFRYEAKTIAHLNHENIVKVYDIEELYRTIFIIMEYLEGVPLDSILEKMPRLPLSKVLDIVLQVCAGLEYAHGQGIVHQDIKPGNIFIQSNNRAKIVDFGLACPPGTIDCELPGTVFYMSPEQIEGLPMDERTDIYSLGITAFEMITGQRPFPEDDIMRLMDSDARKDVPDPRTLVPDLPDELYDFIVCATQPDPAGRYKNISQALYDLKPLAEKMGVKRETPLTEQRKMMSLFLFYEDQHELVLKRLIEDFSLEIKKAGAELRAAEFKDV
ncbi:MAG: protein kinase [Desulfobacterales bacterium]|nr:protein kinase [Desulfobacterales bacterium]